MRNNPYYIFAFCVLIVVLLGSAAIAAKAIDAKSKPLSIQWLGSVFVRCPVDETKPKELTRGKKLQDFCLDPETEIGLREDGIVVWRKKPANKKSQ